MQKIIPVIRHLELTDIPGIVEAFQQLGWNKPSSQYKHYLAEQEAGARDVYVAFVNAQFVGYLTIHWTSDYPPFQKEKIPGIVDFNILTEFRRQGIGTALMDRAESEIAEVNPIAGIGVGMTPDYGAAQRMYVLRGYVPDGRGLYDRDHYPMYGEQIIVSDETALYLTKNLKRE